MTDMSTAAPEQNAAILTGGATAVVECPYSYVGGSIVDGLPRCSARVSKKRVDANGFILPCMETKLGRGCRCRGHGGWVPTGAASGQWNGGSSTQLLGLRRTAGERLRGYFNDKDLRTKYDAGIADPDSRSLAGQIAHLKAQEADAIERLNNGGPSTALWLRLRDARSAIADARAEAQAAMDRGDMKAKAMAMGNVLAGVEEMLAIVDKGSSKAESRREAAEASLMVAKLCAMEDERKKTLSQYVPIEDALRVMQELPLMVRRYVKDRNERQALALELAAMYTKWYGRKRMADESRSEVEKDEAEAMAASEAMVGEKPMVIEAVVPTTETTMADEVK